MTFKPHGLLHQPQTLSSADQLDGLETWLPHKLSQTDKASMFSAECALTAWLDLPLHRKTDVQDVAAHTLYDAAFGLLSSREAKADLVHFGALESLKIDDAYALRGFLALGAKFHSAEVVDLDYAIYSQSWRTSVLHECAVKRRWATLKELTNTPGGRDDIAQCEALFKEPSKNPLYDVDIRSLFDADKQHASPLYLDDAQKAEALKNLTASTEIIISILQGHAKQTDNLGMSLTVAELLQGNPLFCTLQLMTQNADDSHNALAHEALDALNAAGLWNKDRISHRETLVSMCRHGSTVACSWAVNHGVSPEDVGAEAQELLMQEVARHGLLDDSSFANFCRPWTSKSGFADRMVEHVSKRCQYLHGDLMLNTHDTSASTYACEQALLAMSALSKALIAPECGFSKPSTLSLASARTILDDLVLDTLDRNPPLKWASKAVGAAACWAELILNTKPVPRL